MPEFQGPDTFTEAIERDPKPIAGVTTSTAAFLGEAERGPTRPRLITSYGEYLRLYGDVFADDKYLPFGVKAFFDNGGRRAYIARIVGPGAKVAEFNSGGYQIRANGPGSAGNRIFVRITESTAEIRNAAGDAIEPLGFRVQIACWNEGHPEDLFDPFEQGGDVKLPRPSIVEDYDGLSLDPSSAAYWKLIIKDATSALIEFEVADDSAATQPGEGDVIAGFCEGGDDGGDVTVVQFEGNRNDAGDQIDDPLQCRGLAALNLDLYRDVAIVHAPGIGNDDLDKTAIQKEIVKHCERNRFRFAVLDSARNLNAISDERLNPRDQIDSQYAAFYYPWYHTTHPRTGVKTLVPPGGAACGLYAWTDATRGVWKAPANVPVAGAIDLEHHINTGQQEILNPRGVNCIRHIHGRGIRVWGARTLSSDPHWKYVSVKRFLIFLEASIRNATEWVVSEPNDRRLWARVQQTISLFLRVQWREGGLLGAKEEEAFLVRVGADTMTTADIQNGRLIVEIGVAPTRPAEFVIFRISHRTRAARR